MNFAQRRAVYADLNNYCHLAKPHDMVEVCEWVNGEGWDITVADKMFQLTMGELQAIQVLCAVAHPKESV
jgi:hypothetical protein